MSGGRPSGRRWPLRFCDRDGHGSIVTRVRPRGKHTLRWVRPSARQLQCGLVLWKKALQLILRYRPADVVALKSLAAGSARKFKV
jgi:hypothetical protein